MDAAAARTAAATPASAALPASPASPARRGRPGYDRAQVMTIAVQLFNDQGYDATSVADLAAKLGYAEPSAFHRAFRKWTGTTPAAWRRAVADRRPVAQPSP